MNMKKVCATTAFLTLVATGPFAQKATDTRAGSSGAVPGKGGDAAGHAKPLPTFVEKRQKERVAAADLVAKGLATPDASGIVTLRNGRFVKYRLQGEEYLTTALIDFSDVRHGQIPPPDRSTDNSSYWSADVSPQHYWDMLFSA